MKVRSVTVWPTNGQTSIKARVKVEFETSVGNFAINGFRVVQVNGREPFVTAPQESYVGKGGEKKYSDVMWLDRQAQNFIFSRVIEEFKQTFKTAS